MHSLIALLLATTSPTLTPQTLSVSIGNSLENALVQKEPAHGVLLAAQVARLLRWRGDLNRKVQKNDRLQLIYLPNDAAELVALRYQGALLELRAYGFTGTDNVLRYYDETGKLVEPLLLDSPVKNYIQITETVQHGRGRRQHHGIDLKAYEGTPVTVPFSGIVKRVNWGRRVNGNCVEIINNNGNLTRFLHLQSVDPSIRVGRIVKAGNPLGTVGTTGKSNAPHLHYEIINTAGKPLEPLNIHGQGKIRLNEQQAAEFIKLRDKYDVTLRIRD